MRLSSKISLVLSLLIVGVSQAQAEVICIGACGTTSLNVVYFHGLEPINEPFSKPQGLQLRNRELLKKIVSTQNACIALPMAPFTCSNGSGRTRCWNSPGPYTSTLEETLALSQITCFPGAPVKGLVGFSNGGFFINHLYQNCHLASFYSLSVGADQPKVGPPTRDLKSCGQLALMSSEMQFAGKNLIPYYQSLKTKGANATLQMMPGAEHHLFPEISEWLAEVSK